MGNVDIDTALAWRGRTVRDPEGEKVGTFGDVFLDRETDRPEWGGVRTGLFGRHESYVPLTEVEEDEGDLRVPFTKEQVTGAPRIDPDVALTEEEERTLFAHYGREHAARPAERVRLRKVLVTEHQERTIPVRKEVVQLESEPPPSGRIERVEDVDEQR